MNEAPIGDENKIPVTYGTFISDLNERSPDRGRKQFFHEVYILVMVNLNERSPDRGRKVDGIKHHLDGILTFK